MKQFFSSDLFDNFDDRDKRDLIDLLKEEAEDNGVTLDQLLRLRYRMTLSEVEDMDWYDLAYITDYLDEYYQIIEDKRDRISFLLSKIKMPNDLIVFADLGRWDSRVQGHKILTNNLGDIIYALPSEEEKIVFCLDDENKTVVATGSHHDGTDYFEFRMLKDEDIENTDSLYEVVKEALGL